MPKYTPPRSPERKAASAIGLKTTKSPAAERPPGFFMLNDVLRQSAGRGQDLAEGTGFRQRRNPRLVITQRVAQHLFRVLAQQGRGDRVDGGRQRHIERGLD